MEDSNVKAKEQQSQETAAVTHSTPNWIRRRYMVVAAVFLLVLAAAVIVRPLDRRNDPKPQQAAISQPPPRTARGRLSPFRAHPRGVGSRRASGLTPGTRS